MHVAMVTILPAGGENARGGVAVVTGALIQALMRKGVKVTAVEFEPSRTDRYIHPTLHCPVIPLPMYRPAIVMNWLRASRELNRIVQEVRPDVVHVQAVPELGVALRCPSVLTTHGISYRDEWLLGGRRKYLTTPFMAFTFWWCRRHYRHVIMITPYSRAIGGFRRDAELIDIPNPVDDRFFDVQRKPFSPTVLVVGLLSQLKNTLGVVRVAARLRRDIPDVRFRIAGPWRSRGQGDTYRQEVEEFCRRESLGGTVEFLGRVSPERVLAELSDAACLFLPSFQENSPMTIIEALAAGVPAVASRVGGIPWLVSEGKTGLLFDPHDEDAMASNLARVLTTASLRGAMGLAAKQDAWGRFRSDVVADQTLGVYRRAAGEPVAPGSGS